MISIEIHKQYDVETARYVSSIVANIDGEHGRPPERLYIHFYNDDSAVCAEALIKLGERIKELDE